MTQYIHQQPEWPAFQWDHERLLGPLADVRNRQGRFLGHIEALGFELQAEAQLETLTLDVLKSSEIEGELLNRGQVRSSVARRLGMDIAGLIPADRHVEGTVEMMLDATQHFSSKLTEERLFDWHAALFPTGRSGMYKIITAAWRDGGKGPMQVVSGPMGREHIHFEAPDSTLLEAEMERFLDWLNNSESQDPVLKAGIAHLWFVTIHPFDDGNGRIGRAITDLLLARADGSPQRFYSMSAQIQRERNTYYDMLERTQKSSLDITEWLLWFIACLGRAITASNAILSAVLQKAAFWNRLTKTPVNDRQRLMLNMLLDGFAGKLTTSKWAKIAKCSPDTALRDIQDLIEKGVLAKDHSGGRSTGYLLVQTMG
jgi:Fic family protein